MSLSTNVAGQLTLLSPAVGSDRLAGDLRTTFPILAAGVLA